MADDGATEFLQELAKQVAANTEGDSALAAILAEHLVQVQPKKDAIALAKTAMIALASKRAEIPEAPPNV